MCTAPGSRHPLGVIDDGCGRGRRRAARRVDQQRVRHPAVRADLVPGTAPAVDDAFLFKSGPRGRPRHGLLATSWASRSATGVERPHINLSLEGGDNPFGNDNADESLDAHRQCIAKCWPTTKATRRAPLRSTKTSRCGRPSSRATGPLGLSPPLRLCRGPGPPGGGQATWSGGGRRGGEPRTRPRSCSPPRLGRRNELENHHQDRNSLKEIDAVCPPNLEAALDALEADTETRRAVGPEMVARSQPWSKTWEDVHTHRHRLGTQRLSLFADATRTSCTAPLLRPGARVGGTSREPRGRIET